MEIVTERAEEQLAELLLTVQKQPAAWLCAHVNIAPVHAQALATEGLSRKSLEKIHQLSTQIAYKMVDSGLGACDGTIFVFQDGDIVSLFRQVPDVVESVLTALRRDFTASAMLHILSIYQMQERLSDLISLAEEKQESAADYYAKRRAIEIAETILQTPIQDADLTRLIQKKRRQRGSSCVLVIEDDILTRGLVTSCLKGEHRVVPAKDAYDGVCAYIDNAPDVVFLDIELPDINGDQLLSRLLTLDPQAYVVMLSAHSDKDTVLTTRTQGAAGFVRKPFSKDKLLAYIRECPSLSLGPTIRARGWRKADRDQQG